MAQLRDLLVTGVARFVNGAYFGGASTFGSATRPIWWNNGFPQATTYSLSATLNAGSANRLAYYSGANAVSASAHYASATQVGINITNIDTIGSRALYVNGTSQFSDDIYANKSIRNLAVGGGLYWNPYVESTTDGSDAASITLIKSGIAGGTELRISQQDNDTDVINLYVPNYIYLKSKRAFTVNDEWLRINDNSAFSSGIYTGTSLIRTDNQLQVGDAGANFYVKNTGDAFIQKTLGIGGVNISYKLYVNGTSSFEGTIESKAGTISSSTAWTYPGGGYYSTANPNVRFIGDGTYGISTIEFVSQKNTTSINKPSDCAYIQFQPYGHSAMAAIGSQPTLASSGESNKLIIGVNNDADDMIYLQTPSNTGLRHIIGTGNYVIPHTGNTTGSVGSATQPVYLNAGTITPITYELKATINAGTINRISYYSGANTVSSGNNIWTNGTKLGINTTSEHNYQFYVNGVSYFNGDVAVSSNITLNGYNVHSNDTMSLGDTNDYERVVIALCQTSAANTGLNSFWSGQIYRHRYNGLVQIDTAYVSFESQYSGAEATTYSMFSDRENVSTSALSGEGYRACTFTYNGITYAGLEFYQTQAATFFMHGTGNFKPFMIRYYNANTGGVLESTINSTIAYNKCLRANYYLNGNATTATALTTSAGNTGQPVYFSGGKPVAIDWHIGNSGVGEHNCNNVTYNFCGYYTSNGPATSLGASTTDGALYAQAYNSTWVGQIAQDYRNGSLYVRGKNNGTWQSWYKVLDSRNYTNTLDSTYLKFNGWWSNGSGQNVNDAKGIIFAYSSHGLPGAWGVLTTLEYQLNVSYKHQIYGDGWNNTMYFRTASSDRGGFNAWKRLWAEGDAVTSAVWNDYAECRKSDSQEPGYVMFEKGDDSLSKTIERLQHFAGIISDTWGFSQGETKEAKTNIAVAGRVLAYPYRDRNEYKPGDCVCAAPGGTVDIMTREEIINYPDRIVGTVSCVPTYEEWGGGELADRDPVKVNGRIWIKVK